MQIINNIREQIELSDFIDFTKAIMLESGQEAYIDEDDIYIKRNGLMIKRNYLTLKDFVIFDETINDDMIALPTLYVFDTYYNEYIELKPSFVPVQVINYIRKKPTSILYLYNYILLKTINDDIDKVIIRLYEELNETNCLDMKLAQYKSSNKIESDNNAGVVAAAIGIIMFVVIFGLVICAI